MHKFVRFFPPDNVYPLKQREPTALEAALALRKKALPIKPLRLANCEPLWLKMFSWKKKVEGSSIAHECEVPKRKIYP